MGDKTVLEGLARTRLEMGFIGCVINARTSLGTKYNKRSIHWNSSNGHPQATDSMVFLPVA